MEKDRLLIKGIKEVKAQFAEQPKVDRLIIMEEEGAKIGLIKEEKAERHWLEKKVREMKEEMIGFRERQWRKIRRRWKKHSP